MIITKENPKEETMRPNYPQGERISLNLIQSSMFALIGIFIFFTNLNSDTFWMLFGVGIMCWSGWFIGYNIANEFRGDKE